MDHPQQIAVAGTEPPDSSTKPRFSSRVAKAPPQPASVKINVEGAFIANDETINRNGASEYVHWEHKDIRLPHHTDVVSHVAIDVSDYELDDDCVPKLTFADRRLVGETGIFLKRIRVRRWWRKTQFP